MGGAVNVGSGSVVGTKVGVNDGTGVGGAVGTRVTAGCNVGAGGVTGGDITMLMLPATYSAVLTMVPVNLLLSQHMLVPDLRWYGV